MSYCFIDLNQVLIANLMQHLKMITKTHELDEGLIRHMAINTIRSNVKQFKNKYPNIVLCCDNRHYWRKDYFPFYKSQRKHDREASGLDWHLIFETLNKIRDELKENFPYKVLDVHGAEADDIIAVLTARLSAHSDVLILSSDKDFGQLQKYGNVTQYSPILKRFIKVDDPQRFIKEHILKGDRGDGIPNFLSPDNCFAVGERQKTLNSKRLQEWVNQDAEAFCTSDTTLRGYKRNQTLIDFDYIPGDIREAIVEAFESAQPASRAKMIDYFMAKGLKAMNESISDF
jgi:hypothetical protein